MPASRFARFAAAALIAACGAAPFPAQAKSYLSLPILVPITGFVALEGTSQKNGALLAIKDAQDRLKLIPQVIDTGAAPEGAVTAFERALGMDDAQTMAVIAPILGTQMLALLPLADRYKLPLLTISGTAKITELGSPWVFRFFPGDATVKLAQARYAVEKLGKKKPALLYQTTAYGQSGRDELSKQFAALGTPLVYEEGLAPTVKDLLPALTKAINAGADVLILQLHAPSTAMAIGQARGAGITLPIVAGSAMHQPATAALLSPQELNGVCAESASSPISGGNAAMQRFTEAYRREFASEPDAFAVAQYDATMMLIAALLSGAKDGEAVRAYIATHSYDGLAMTYRSDTKGNMAHDAIIVCFDGETRVPTIVERYPGK